ncbi:38720_t:CDS:2, partial [Gigaspora margarita]
MGLVKELTELSIRNGSIYAGLPRNIRVTDPLDNYDKQTNYMQQLKKAQSENKKIQQTVRSPLFKYKKDKRNKDWIIFEDQK